MALLFMDGFDHYSVAQMSRKWTAMTNTSFTAITTGRTGNGVNRTTDGGGGHNGTVNVKIPDTTTFIVGFALRIVGGGTNGSWGEPLFILGGPSLNLLFFLRITSSGGITVISNNNGTALGTSSNVLTIGSTWYYIETKVTLNGTTGSYDIHVNGSSVLSGTNVNTTYTNITTCSQVCLGPWGWNSVNFIFDDFYVLDTTGSFNNTFLGNSYVDTFYPNGNGVESAMTPTGATNNWQCVSDNGLSNDDTNYVGTSVASNADLYTIPTLPNYSNIYGIQVNLESRNDDAVATHVLKDRVRSGGTDYNGKSNNPTSSYLIYPHPWDFDPATSGAWTLSGANNAQYGQVFVS